MRLFEEISKYYRKLLVEPIDVVNQPPAEAMDLVKEDITHAIRTLEIFRDEAWDTAFSGNLEREHHREAAVSSILLMEAYNKVIEDLEGWEDGE